MEKKDIIRIFDSISDKYDFTNIILSAGIEKLWRRRFLKNFSCSYETVLDVCCGTGISTYNINRIYSRKNKRHIYGIDFSENMINVARKKYNGIGSLSFDNGDATNLNFEDNFFDCISIVFGIRNIIERKAALKEFYRVSKPNGKLLIMEFGHIEKGPFACTFACIYNFYLEKILPDIGGFLTKNKDAYKYLVESIKEFPESRSFIKSMENAGWKNCKAEHHTFGACNIYYGYKTV